MCLYKMWSAYFIFFISTLLWGRALSESCKTPLQQFSTCVSLYDCPPLLSAFEQRPLKSDVIDFLKQSQCGFEGYTPRVCCGPLPAETMATTTVQQQPARPARPSYGGQTAPVFDEDSVPEPRSTCGIDTNGDRILGGQFTELDEFPWMALLGYLTPSKTTTYQCGGSLINKRYVLTAAHCIVGEIRVKVGSLSTVRLGEYDTQKEVDCLNGACADPVQEISVQSAHAHPGYSDSNKNRKDDIGLVRLSRQATYTYYVQPICLTNGNERLNVGNSVFVAGWGKTLSGKNSPIKLKLSLPIFNKNDCVTKYRELGAELTNNQICAGGVFIEDACRGDSGGPLMKKRPGGIWECVAVVSFGYGCGREGWPAVYSSVASYSGWIRDTLRSTNV